MKPGGSEVLVDQEEELLKGRGDGEWGQINLISLGDEEENEWNQNLLRCFENLKDVGDLSGRC